MRLLITMSCSAGDHMDSHTPLSRTEPSALGFWVAANLPQKKLSSNQLGVWDGRAWSADREWCESVTDVTAAQPQPQTHLPHILTEFRRRGVSETALHRHRDR